MQKFSIGVFALSFFGWPLCTLGESKSEVTNSIGMRFVLIPAGTFIMGSPSNEVNREHNETQHQVTLSSSFLIGIYEVTQGQFEMVMKRNPSKFPRSASSNIERKDFPVESVTWDEANEFCIKLSKLAKEVAASHDYRLPTEAEWEYACRAGTTTSHSCDLSNEKLLDYAWFNEPTSSQPLRVGQKKPNPWGIYDMHGNVWEYCSDWHGDSTADAVTDPKGPSSGDSRIFRGGGWFSPDFACRSALRYGMTPTDRNCHIGFRIVLSLPKN